MGVKNLSKLIRQYAPAAMCNVSLAEYRGKCVAVDANIFVYKFLHGVDTHANAALYGFLDLDRWFRKHGVDAIYVFDGNKLEAKRSEIKRRWTKRRKLMHRVEECKQQLAQIKRQEQDPRPKLRGASRPANATEPSARKPERSPAKEQVRLRHKEAPSQPQADACKPKPSEREKPGEPCNPFRRVPAPPTPTLQSYHHNRLADELAMLKQQIVHVSPQQIMDCYQMLRLAGCCALIAEHEAEATCATLTRMGIAHAVVTEDMDALPFGGVRVLRDVRPHVSTVTEIDLRILLVGLRLDKEAFVDLCIMCGCDFATPPRNMSCHQALSMLRRYGSIERVLHETKSWSPPMHYQSRGATCDAAPYETAREVFLNPLPVELPERSAPDPLALDNFLRKRSLDRSYGKHLQFGAHWNQRLRKAQNIVPAGDWRKQTLQN